LNQFNLYKGTDWGQIVPTMEEYNTHVADYIRQPAFAATTGTNVAYEVTLDPPLSSYQNGVGITIVPHVNSGNNPTLNINGLGAVALKSQSGESAQLKANIPYTFKYIGSQFISDSGLITNLSADNIRYNAIVGGVNGQYSYAPSTEVPSAGDILSGKSAFINGGQKIQGSMVKKTSQQSIDALMETGAVSMTVPQGYWDGIQNIYALDSDISAANIKKDVSMLGLTGTLQPGVPFVKVTKSVNIPSAATTLTITVNAGFPPKSWLCGAGLNGGYFRYTNGWVQSGLFGDQIAGNGIGNTYYLYAYNSTTTPVCAWELDSSVSGNTLYFGLAFNDGTQFKADNPTISHTANLDFLIWG
jgi:hypothetical protein